MDQDNKSFCAVPFVSTMINTDTTIRYCCMVKGSFNKLKKKDGDFYTCKDNFINDAWNSQDMREIRKAMIRGDKVEGCAVCYLQEESGRSSNRQHSIKEWNWRIGKDGLKERVEQAIDNDGIVFDEPVYLDLRLGNLCNLKCRMCNPWNSSQIAKEHIELNEKDEKYREVWKNTFGTFPISVMDDQQWFESNIMWDQVMSLIPTLKKVYMTGGEPTLISHNFKFMETCIEEDRRDIELFFNTNCTNVNKKFLELISQFNRISINASLDGIGYVNEYIRAPSKWSQISENVEKIAKLSNVNLGITPTVQVYNVFNLVDILKWVDYLNEKYNKTIFVDLLINVHPHQLSVTVLPDEIRHEVADELEKYLTSKDNIHTLTRNSVNGIIGLLRGPRANDWEKQLEALQIYTQSLDKERSQDIALVDERLARLLNER